MDEVNETTLAPGQISIYDRAEYEREFFNRDREPLEPAFLNETETLPNHWSGNIRFGSRSRSVLYAGMGNHLFIMDCGPGTFNICFYNTLVHPKSFFCFFIIILIS